MIRFFLLAFSIFLSVNVFSQSDSVFLNQNPDPLLGKASINYRKEKITVNDGKNNLTFTFNDVRRISYGNGLIFVNENIKSRRQLLMLLVEGKFSLFFNERDKQFYVRKSDSLLVIPQAHFKRALPIIFGKETTDSYYEISNVSPVYTASYLQKLTSYVNGVNQSREVVYQPAVKKFKTTLNVGPYIGFAHNRIAYDLYWDNVKGVSIYRKSDFYASNSVPLGVSIDLRLFEKFSLRLDTYFNQTSNKDLNVDNMGSTKHLHPNSPLNSDKYAEDVKFTGYAYKTIHLDLAASWILTKAEQSKMRPYVFAGPSIVRMNSNEIGVAVGYSETAKEPFQYMTRNASLQRAFIMTAVNAGAGVQYSASDRLTFRLSGKYIHGIFPKLINPGYSGGTDKSIPMRDETWNQVYHRFNNAYDQYTRIFNITGAVYFRL